MDRLHRHLVTTGRGDPFDRHVFACAIVAGLADADRALTVSLGLAPATLADMLSAYFPTAWRVLPAGTSGVDAGQDELEEPDLRAFLLEHRTCGTVEEVWLAAVIARRSLGANHLWQDLGLFGRDELNRLMERHFTALKRLNADDMKWKKFFYRQLCERDGAVICKAPNCGVCSDAPNCFGAETGEPLAVLRSGLLDVRQKRRTV